MNLGATEFENQRNLYRQQVDKAKETFDPTDMAVRQLTESFAPLIGTESTLTGVKQLIGRTRDARALANKVRNLKPDVNGRFSQAVQNLRARVGLNPTLPADAEDPIQMDDPDIDTELPPGIRAPYPSRPEVDEPLDQDDHDEGFDRGVDSVDQTTRETGQVPDPDDIGEVDGSESFKIGARAGQLARIGQYADGAELPDALGDAQEVGVGGARTAALADTNQVLNNLQARNWNPETAIGAKLRGQTAVRAMANNNLKLASGAELNEGDLQAEAVPTRPPIEYNPETLEPPPVQSNESLGIDLARHQGRLAQANKTLSDLDDVESKLQTVKEAGGDVDDTLSRLQTNRAAVQATQQQALDDIQNTKAAMRSGAPTESNAPRTQTSSSLQEQAYHDGLEGAEAPEDDGLLSSYAAGRTDSASMDALKAARPALTGGADTGAGAGADAGTTAATTAATEGGTEAGLDTLSAGLDALGPETGGAGFVLGGLVAAGSAIAAAVAPKKSMAPPPMPNVTVPSFAQGLI